jgi:hypothetical protein
MDQKADIGRKAQELQALVQSFNTGYSMHVERGPGNQIRGLLIYAEGEPAERLIKLLPPRRLPGVSPFRKLLWLLLGRTASDERS